MTWTASTRRSAWIFVAVGTLIVLFIMVITPIAVVFNHKEYRQQFFLDRNGRSAVASVDDLEKEVNGLA